MKAELQTELTMTAEATGVKKISVNFNQAVDTTTTTITVKKGSATPAITSTTPSADATSYELAMGTKLTAGTYTVEAVVGDKTLTADITVKDETMTSFQLVSTNLVATPTSSGAATISYKALNQYGETMAAPNVTPSCSFGTVSDEATKTYAPTADKNGKVTVEGIPATLAIEGQTGTLVLVNTDNGVSLNETITYRSKAVASAANVLGIYSTKTESVIDGNLKVGASLGDYVILVNIQDQYGSDMDATNIADSASTVTLNPASVLTDLTVDSEAKTIESSTVNKFADVTYNGVSCVAIPLSSTVTGATSVQKAGTLSLTIVGANKGVLATPSFTVDDVVLIESFSVSASETLYDGTKSKLAVEAVDVNGNAVTSYDELKSAFTWSTSYGTISLEKNSDGTGTFYFKPDVFTNSTAKQNTSLPATVIFNANEPTSGKYIVKPVSFTVYEKKVPVKVAGVASDAVTAVAVSSSAILAFDLNKVTFEDQYSNTLKYSDVEADSVTAYLVDNSDIFNETTGTVAASSDKLSFTSNEKKGNATLYLKYKTSAAGGDDTAASAEAYDIKVTLSAVDVSGVTSSDLTLTVNDGRTIYGANKIGVEKALDVKTVDTTYDETASAVAQTASAIVTAKVGGKNVVIPTNLYTITEGSELGGYGKVSKEVAEKTEEKTVTIVFGDAGTVKASTTVTVSNANAKAVEIKDASSTTVTASNGSVDKSVLCNAIKVVDQYGNSIDITNQTVLCTVTFTGTNADAAQKLVKKNATQDVSVALETGKYTASVTYVYAGLTYTTNVTIEV